MKIRAKITIDVDMDVVPYGNDIVPEVTDEVLNTALFEAVMNVPKATTWPHDNINQPVEIMFRKLYEFNIEIKEKTLD